MAASNERTKISSVKKIRFDGLDVLALTSYIHKNYLGSKVVNIYDGMSSSSNTGKNSFVFKLQGTAVASSSEIEGEAASSSASSNKINLLMESGIRFHTTKYHEAATTNVMPSNFTMKLRKHLRNLRLESIQQLGNLDRVVDFTFGSGSKSCFHVILELYAKGNVVLTDYKYEILSLLRTHDFNDVDRLVKVAVKEIYPVTFTTTLQQDLAKLNIDSDQKNEAKEEKVGEKNFAGILLEETFEKYYEWILSEVQNHEESKQKEAAESKSKTKKKKKKKGDESTLTLKTLLSSNQSSGVFRYGSALIEHCIISAKLDPNLTLSNNLSLEDLKEILTQKNLETLKLQLTEEGGRVIESLRTGSAPGYIFYQPKTLSNGNANDNQNNVPLLPHSDKVFEDFQPFILQNDSFKRQHLTYETYASAIDDFFSLLETQRRIQKSEQAENAAKNKLEKIQKDQEQRILSLLNEQEKLRHDAELVEMHADVIDKAIIVVNSALNTGMDWENLEMLVQVEKNNDNPVAKFIHELDLERNSIIMSLPDFSTDDEESKLVNVALNKTAHANAREMFDKYRQSKEKSSKTIEQLNKALKAAEVQTQKQLEEVQKQRNRNHGGGAANGVNRFKKQHWFEKFHWFITSDNYLVLAGRDAQQNEILVKRYLREGDVYLHADVHGASSCILRAKRKRMGNKSTVLPLPERALQEAGNFTICLSSAWGSKIVTSAWYVQSHQVSKTAPSGEYLTVGSFMIRGKKTFLKPSALEMGLAVLFRLGDEDSMARHINDRRDFSLMVDEDNDYFEEKNDSKRKEGKLNMNDVNYQSEFNIGKDIQNLLHDNTISPSVEEESYPAEKVIKDYAEVLHEKDSHISLSYESVVTTDGEKIVLASVKNNENEAQNEEKKLQVEFESQQKVRKGLSVKDRKLIKKYGSLEAAEAAMKKQAEKELSVTLIDSSQDAVSVMSDFTKATTSNETTSSFLTKRQKLKQKKIAQKYADQDEEDRELALLALHGGEKDKKKGKKSSKRGKNVSEVQKEAAAATASLLMKKSFNIAEKFDEEIKLILSSCLLVNNERSSNVEDDLDLDEDSTKQQVSREMWNEFDTVVLESLLSLTPLEAQVAGANRLLFLIREKKVDNLSASLSGIIRTIKKFGFESLDKSLSDSKSRPKNNYPQMKEDQEEEDIETIVEAIDDTVELSKLTGKPVNDDLLLYALPVCAPYISLSNYKYRVKLTPGSAKRGKAAKQCLEILLQSSNSEDSKRNKDLINKITDNEWVQAMIGEVKIAAAGVSKVVKKQKKKNKK